VRGNVSREECTVRKGNSLVLGVAAGLTAAAIIVGGAAGAGSPKAAALQQVNVKLDSAHVKPAIDKQVPGASGTFSATWDGSILRYTLLFTGLTGTASTAQIHYGGSGATGALAQPLCDPCLAPETGVVPLYAAQIVALKAGRLYIAITTGSHPNGEIRGQLRLGK